ncbi:hypothetical protein [Pseudoalteromonas umbrosa]|uniref:hypothetical protein n=1 Tax=Pseudoalteromonas umbrosa TaxID=3048489 RepID=UPI0024C28075|nr:hypothetical protein [Pseudoalteromonas sp. B95]MDK1288629.1 hypothetical protein [Pseudoalteromonas sp. B95]
MHRFKTDLAQLSINERPIQVNLRVNDPKVLHWLNSLVPEPSLLTALLTHAMMRGLVLF